VTQSLRAAQARRYNAREDSDFIAFSAPNRPGGFAAHFTYGVRSTPGTSAENAFVEETHMAVERTLSIIKPDATRRNLTGEIVARFEKAGLRVVAQKRMRLSRQQAEAFYAVHKERPFFGGLVEFMTSGPVVVQVLQGEGAIAKNREVMGATNPEKAAPGTIRKDFAENIEANSVHGSDAPETAANEIRFFFSDLEIVG
jgi:nucleoside-diphosphate kinase